MNLVDDWYKAIFKLIEKLLNLWRDGESLKKELLTPNDWRLQKNKRNGS